MLGRMKEERVAFIVAPTRASCKNVEVLLKEKEFTTRLMSANGDEIINLARERKPFGVIAGTGSGKSASLGRIVKEWLGVDELQITVVTREYPATEETWCCNTIIITPGIALVWAKNRIIRRGDVIVFDEVHQTSGHLELAEALSLRAGCDIIWMSATVDEKFFSEYLKSKRVIKFTEKDKSKRPFVIFMTNVGQSGINVEGLNTVVVIDECITEELINSAVVRVRIPLPDNDLIQMIGRIGIQKKQSWAL